MSIAPNYHKTFSSPELERHALAGYLIHPNTYVDVDLFIKETDFVFQSHRIIYSVARSLRLSNTRFDCVILAQKVKELGIVTKDEIDIYTYLSDVLYTSQISSEATLDAFRQLEKNRILVELCEQSDRVKEYVLKNREKDVDKIVSGVDAIISDKLSLHVLKDEPKDIYEGVIEMLEATGKNPVETPGLLTGFPSFDSKFGGVYGSNGLYCVVSRAKTGKSTLLLNLAQNMTSLNKDTISLYLDTELTTKLEQFRLMSAMTGVRSFYLETGQWKQNQAYRQQVEEKVLKATHPKGAIYHIRCAGKPLDEILSIIRRFYYRYASGRKRLVVFYDYIKITGENISQSNSETMAIGSKIDAFNNLSFSLGEEIYVWTAAQANRDAAGPEGREDDAVVALSDRISWFGGHVALLKYISLDDLADFGQDIGTHAYIPLVSRFQGKEEQNGLDLINIAPPGKKKKFKRDYLCFDFKNFKVTDKGTLKNYVHRLHHTYQLNKPDGVPVRPAF